MYKVNVCPVCNSSMLRRESYHTVSGVMHGWSQLLSSEEEVSYSVVCCRNCWFLFRDLRFDNGDMDALYGASDSPKFRLRPYSDYYDRSKEIEAVIIDHSALSSISHLKILDVGGGRGELTEYFASQLNCKVDVLEFGAIGVASEGSIRFVNRPDYEEYDIVIFSHILEHLSDPKDFLSSILDDVPSNAVVYVEVPFELVSYMIFRTHGHYEHLNYFSVTSVKNLLACIGISQSKVVKRLGFGRSLPVVSAIFSNTRLGSQLVTFQRKSPLFDALSILSIVLYLISKARISFGMVAESHKKIR